MDGLAWRKIVRHPDGDASADLTNTCGYSHTVLTQVEPSAEQEDATPS
jgi:hypothetical protein